MKKIVEGPRLYIGANGKLSKKGKPDQAFITTFVEKEVKIERLAMIDKTGSVSVYTAERMLEKADSLGIKHFFLIQDGVGQQFTVMDYNRAKNNIVNKAFGAGPVDVNLLINMAVSNNYEPVFFLQGDYAPDVFMKLQKDVEAHIFRV